MSPLDVTRTVPDTWECFNNQNPVDQLQPLWLTSSIKKYGGAPSINADRLAGPASTWGWPTSWVRSFLCGAAPPATASRGPTIDQETGNQTGCMERVSQNAAFTGMRLASMQQAMHLRPRSQLASQYFRQSLYGQP